MAHPCCGSDGRLKIGVQIIAMLEMIGFSIAIGCLTIFLGFSVSSLDGSGELTFVFVFLVVVIVIAVVMFLIALRLWNGAKEENVSKCQTWRTVSIVLFCLGCIDNFLYFIKLLSNNSGSDTTDSQPPSGTIEFPATAGGAVQRVFSTLLHAYFIWVVSAFITRLRHTQTQYQTADTASANLV